MMLSIIVISKNEPALRETLRAVCLQSESLENVECEVIVVDASSGDLDYIHDEYKGRVNWIEFQPVTLARTTIPHQRNVGVRHALGEIIVFTDAGCIPESEWLVQLINPLLDGENMTFGLALGTSGGMRLHDRVATQRMRSIYQDECSTINTAFRREVYNTTGGFDEAFAYGSDVDFSWRAIAAGYRIRSVPDAIVRHDWGTGRRQARRSYLYGRARTRLYRKHPHKFRHAVIKDPMVVAYPLFLICLPLTLVFPIYPALLLIPAWRNRADGPLYVVIDHLIFGTGVLAELVLGGR